MGVYEWSSQEGGQALIMAARNLRAIYAQSTRTSTVAVAFLGFFFGCAHTARRPNSSPMSVRIPHRPARSLRAVYAHLHRPSHTFTDIAQQSTRSLRAVKKKPKNATDTSEGARRLRVDCA